MSALAHADAHAATLDLVTVVFAAELPLLVLQARSIARYAEADALGEIVVIANEADEAAGCAAIEALRGEYGRFAGRLRVVAPSSLLEAPSGAFARLEARWVSRWRARRRALFRRGTNPTGWGGNSGWAMQQAFKLLSVRVCRSSHVVFLDAKNHFLRPLEASLFVDERGRARSRALDPDERQRGWIAASFAALGLSCPPPERAPPSVTPFAIERDRLAEAVERLSRRLGALERFFALRRRGATEFMLLFAALDEGRGRWWTLFGEGLPVSVTVFGSADRDTLLDTLRTLARHPAPLAGVHRRHLERPDPELREALLALWSGHGLLASADEFDRLFGPRTDPGTDPRTDHSREPAQP